MYLTNFEGIIRSVFKNLVIFEANAFSFIKLVTTDAEVWKKKITKNDRSTWSPTQKALYLEK